MTVIISDFVEAQLDAICRYYREVGYPDYLDYEGNGGVALSWWKFTLKNKKSGEIKRMNIHSQMWFNTKGKIGREDVYYNANLLN